MPCCIHKDLHVILSTANETMYMNLLTIRYLSIYNYIIYKMDNRLVYRNSNGPRKMKLQSAEKSGTNWLRSPSKIYTISWMIWKKKTIPHFWNSMARGNRDVSPSTRTGISLTRSRLWLRFSYSRTQRYPHLHSRLYTKRLDKEVGNANQTVFLGAWYRHCCIEPLWIDLLYEDREENHQTQS